MRCGAKLGRLRHAMLHAAMPYSATHTRGPSHAFGVGRPVTARCPTVAPPYLPPLDSLYDFKHAPAEIQFLPGKIYAHVVELFRTFDVMTF